MVCILKVCTVKTRREIKSKKKSVTCWPANNLISQNKRKFCFLPRSWFIICRYFIFLSKHSALYILQQQNRRRKWQIFLILLKAFAQNYRKNSAQIVCRRRIQMTTQSLGVYLLVVQTVIDKTDMCDCVYHHHSCHFEVLVSHYTCLPTNTYKTFFSLLQYLLQEATIPTILVLWILMIHMYYSAVKIDVITHAVTTTSCNKL